MHEYSVCTVVFAKAARLRYELVAMDKHQEVAIPAEEDLREEEVNATAPNFCVTTVTADTVVPYHNRPNGHGNAAGLKNEPDLPDRSKKNAAVIIVVVTALVAIIVALTVVVSVLISQSNATATPKNNAKPTHMDPKNTVFVPQTKVFVLRKSASLPPLTTAPTFS